MFKKFTAFVLTSLIAANCMTSVVLAKPHYSSHRSYSSHSSSRSYRSSTSSRPSSLKSGTKTYRPSNKTTIPRTSSSSKSKTTTKNYTSNNYSIKRRNTSSSSHYVPRYYNRYSDTRYYSNNGFYENYWRYYAISHLFRNKERVSEKDIVRELEKKGYTEKEINQILKGANDEQEKENKDNKKLLIAAIIILIIVIIGLFILFDF